MSFFSKIFNKDDTVKPDKPKKKKIEPIKLANAKFNLNNTLRDVANLLTDAALEKRVSIIYRVDKNVPSTIIGDRYKLTTVLSEIVGNAIDFSDKGENVVVSIRRNVENLDALELYFNITDQGVGISDEAIEKILTPMLRSDEDASSFEITGTGLANARDIVHAMLGSISMSCELKRGCTVSFNILMSSPDTKERRHYRLPSKGGVGLNSLIIDSDQGSANALQSMLEYFKHDVTQKKINHIVELEKYNLIFISSCFMDAPTIELLKERQNKRPKVHIVVIEEMMGQQSDNKNILQISDWLLYKPYTQQFVYEMLSSIYQTDTQEEEQEHSVETGSDVLSAPVKTFLNSELDETMFAHERGLLFFNNNYVKFADKLKDLIWKYVKSDRKIDALVRSGEYADIIKECEAMYKQLKPVGADALAELSLHLTNACKKQQTKDIEELNKIYASTLSKTIASFDQFMEDNKYKIEDAN